MTTEVFGGAPVHPIFKIVEDISDFVSRQERVGGRPDAAAEGSAPNNVWTRLSSPSDETWLSRGSSAYSKSTAARRVERYRQVLHMLAIILI